jgi:hypothetical protein
MHRRTGSLSADVAVATALADERRRRSDRRQHPRRRADMRSIAHFARVIGAGETRLEVIVDGLEGLRLVALFGCGCLATEPIGDGKARVTIEPCPAHLVPALVIERRRRS